jgi:hypothetical protein
MGKTDRRDRTDWLSDPDPVASYRRGRQRAAGAAYGGSVQYSMSYLKSEVQDLQLPDFINHLIPIVEAQFSTPAANNVGNSFVTTGRSIPV